MSNVGAAIRTRLGGVARPGSNPVLRRELVSRWRGRRAFLLLSLYLGLIGGVVVLLYLLGAESAVDAARFELVDAGPTVGRFLFENLLALVLLLVLFIGPGYAASQVVGERERQTLGLLQVTLVRPRSFVLGKLGASLAWLLLLVLATLPFAAASFFLGGVQPGQLARGLAFVLVVAVAVAAMAIGISSVVRSTTAAVVTTYGLVLALTLGTLFGALVEYAVLDTVDRFDDRAAFSLYANPYLGLADAVEARERFDNTPSVLTPFAAALPRANRLDRGGFLGAPDRPAIGFAAGDSFIDGDVAFAQELAMEGLLPDELVDAAFAGAIDPGVLEEIAFGGLTVQEAVDGGLIGDEVLAADAFQQPRRAPVWVQVMGLYVVFGLVGLLVATRRVAVPRVRRRRRPTDAERVAQPTVEGPAAASTGTERA